MPQVYAYHVIGGPNSRAIYNQILADGYLQPASNNNKFGYTRQFALDRLSGDNECVFLSLGRRYPINGESYGFMFEAKNLADSGAIFRRYDLLSDYEDLLQRCLESITPDYSVEMWSQAERELLQKALDDPDWADEHYTDPNFAFQELERKVRQQDMGYPGVVDVVSMFNSEVRLLQNRSQVTDWEYNPTYKEGQVEVLVRGRLPISMAVAHILNGEVVYESR